MISNWLNDRSVNRKQIRNSSHHWFTSRNTKLIKARVSLRLFVELIWKRCISLKEMSILHNVGIQWQVTDQSINANILIIVFHKLYWRHKSIFLSIWWIEAKNMIDLIVKWIFLNRNIYYFFEWQTKKDIQWMIKEQICFYVSPRRRMTRETSVRVGPADTNSFSVD